MYEQDGSIRWAHRIPQSEIRRLYASDAAGMLDEDLLSDLAYRLFERARDILIATAASLGQAACPRCDAIVHHAGTDTVLGCECGWSMAWRDYHKSYKGKQLHGGAATAYFRAFVDGMPGARTSRDKMQLIDWLLHQMHRGAAAGWSAVASSSLPGAEVTFPDPDGPWYRPAAVNVIGGNRRSILELLDELAGLS